MQAVIVGAGASGVLHALALRAAGVKIAAVYDPDTERARSLAEACGAHALDTIASAAAADAAIAAVCSPPSVHGVQAAALASPGRTVFVEKPVATTKDELDKLRELSGCVPILQWRAGRALRVLRRAVLHGEFGSAPFVSCDLAWGRDDAYLRARRGWGCGAMLSIGIHALDAMSWALDQSIDSAAGVSSRSRPDAEAETALVALFRFKGGANASFRISLDGGAETTRITICGGGRTAHLVGGEADPTGNTIQWSSRQTRDRERLEALERDTPGALGSPLLVPYLGAAVAALRDGERPGQSQRLPSISDAYGAHAAAMCVTDARTDRSLAG